MKRVEKVGLLVGLLELLQVSRVQPNSWTVEKRTVNDPCLDLGLGD